MITTHEKAQERLLTAIGAARVSHAFFISSIDPEPARRLACRAAALAATGTADAARLQNCAGFRIYSGSAMRMDDVRELQTELQQSPLDDAMRCILIEEAHGMSAPVQNALLKTLEEPPAATLFLLTGNIRAVLPTVASRCSVLHLGQASVKEIEAILLEKGATLEEARLYAAMGGGSESRSLRLFEEEAFRTLRDNAIDALLRLIRGELPLSATKKLSADRGMADAFTFMLSFLRDVLTLLTKSGAPLENPDKRRALDGILPRFTIGRTACMIEMLTKAISELYTANAGSLTDVAAADKLFLEISEVI
ncbi:MAG: hypothetical protein IJO10_06130 [Clostridia bacterium]|nr:hypothetical protein [Clostridia bacterium]MBQ7113799.1 hypothetical protein [Clostridia bacterium]